MELMTAHEVAAPLKLPASWVYREAQASPIPCVRLGRYRENDSTRKEQEMNSSQPFRMALTVHPDYTDVTDVRHRSLDVMFSANPAKVENALFTLSHRIENQGLEAAFAMRDEATRTASGPQYKITLGAEASHEVAVLLVVAAAFYLKRDLPHEGPFELVLVDPLDGTTHHVTSDRAEGSASDEQESSPAASGDDPVQEHDLGVALVEAVSPGGRRVAQRRQLAEQLEQLDIEALVHASASSVVMLRGRVGVDAVRAWRVGGRG